MLYRNWWAVEGLVLRNGAIAVARIEGDNNVLRRVSAYNADTNDNSAIIFIWGDGNLLEDVAAAGTGRYGIESYQSVNNTIRRAFVMPSGWDGRAFCGVQWPYIVGLGVYNSSGTTVEHAITYGRASQAGIMVQANADGVTAENNAVLGSMALLSGRDADGSIWTYGSGQTQPSARPGPTSCTVVTQWAWGTQRVGFLLWGQGTLRNNVFRDVVAADNMGVGFAAVRPYVSGGVAGNVLERATLVRNGAGVEPWEAAQGGQLYNGLGVQVVAGAPQRDRLPPTPWPMEARIRTELGVSVEAIITKYNQGAGD
jgi:hypothetical protein